MDEQQFEWWPPTVVMPARRSLPHGLAARLSNAASARAPTATHHRPLLSPSEKLPASPPMSSSK
jgi:hypothetical protein